MSKPTEYFTRARILKMPGKEQVYKEHKEKIHDVLVKIHLLNNQKKEAVIDELEKWLIKLRKITKILISKQIFIEDWLIKLNEAKEDK